jgi:8-oxo-dGTP diphosphatase
VSFVHQVKDFNIRVSAKAIVIHDDRILLARYQLNDTAWYTLPGGGQQFGEPLSETLIRECREETGCQIKPGKLVFVREYIGANHEFAESDGDAHQIELMFLASMAEPLPEARHAVRQADLHQVDAEWVPVAEVAELPLFPAALRPLISERRFISEASIYLGDVN